MEKIKLMVFVIGLTVNLIAATYTGKMVEIPGGSFTMGNNAATGPLDYTHEPERVVTISEFRMGETEVTNEQYVDFLNAAMGEGMIKVIDGTVEGNPCRFVVGNDGKDYADQKFYALDGSRVLKDHDNADDDDLPKTGIDPENPLNRSWIEYDEGTETFSLIDPHLVDWDAYPYLTADKLDGTVDEERSDWPELASTSTLPTKTDIADWPVGFIQWYGASIFAEYYGLRLPTEAEWEYCAQGGVGNDYGTDNGSLSRAKANYHSEQTVGPGTVPVLCTHHVEPVKSYGANPFKLYDMAGNVWEWCQDWFGESYYGESGNTNDPVNDDGTFPIESEVPMGTSTSTPPDGYDCKVRRGGSWNYHAGTCLSSARALDFHFRGNDHFGFRVAGDTGSTANVPKSTISFSSVYMTVNGRMLSIGLPTGVTHDFAIYNNRGQKLKSITVKEAAVVNLSDLSKGMYFLRANGINRSFIMR